MKARNKIVLVVFIAVVAIAGLFALRTYYGNKLGIFADILTDEKILVSKLVGSGDFNDDTITNLVRPADVDYYQIQNQGTQICGNFPENVDISGLPSGSNFTLSLSPVAESNELVHNFNDNFYIGNENKTTVGGGSYSMAPSGDNVATDNPGFSVVRGAGWLYLELDKPLSGVNSVQGSITFPSGITLRADSLVYGVDNEGIENATNGTTSLNSQDDEVGIDTNDSRKVNFFFATIGGKDILKINYCFSPQLNLEGSIAGQIDLGAIKPISSLRANTINFDTDRDDVLMVAQISKNGTDWITGPEINARRYNFQGSTPRDSYCFRYVKYTITLKSNSAGSPSPGTSAPLGLLGLDLYGGDTCGTEQPFDPGTPDNLGAACSNGTDDDGDGKIDFKADGTGDPGCTNNMDDDEANATKICQNGSDSGVLLTVTISEHITEAGVDLGKNVYVGSGTDPIVSPAAIQLVSDGVAVKDSGFQARNDELSVFRGEGYFYLHNQGNQLSRSSVRGTFTITGAKISKVINRNYELNGEDSYSIPDQNSDNSASFYTQVLPDNDGVYVYYDYVPKIGGGCQCQDKVDNDNNTFIDFPNDFGCTSAIDNEEVLSDQQLVLYPACKNGLDDDGDGTVDFPNDAGCESVLSNSEADPVKACRAGDQTNISFTVPELQITNSAASAVKTKIITGDGKNYAPGEKIDLVINGNAVIDNTVADQEAALLVKRGPGYIYILSKEESGTKRITEVGKLLLSGSKITKVINGTRRLETSSPFFIGGPFELQGDDVVDETRNNDEFSVASNGLELSFASVISGGSDSAYIYYDYNHTLSGGCQCQDGVDNDNDGKIDFPNDQGCAATEDNDENDTIVALLSQPVKILPALISSGPGFWVLIAIILAISGLSVYLIMKNDKDKLDR